MFALLLAAAPAQQLVTPASATRGAVLATKDGLVLPAGDFAVADLIAACAGYLCRNYLVDDEAIAKVPGFTLQRALSLDALGSEEMLYALLAARGLVALPIDELRGVYQVVPLAPERRTLPVTNVPWRTPEEILRRPRLRELVMTVFPLQHTTAAPVAEALRGLYAVQGMWQPGVPTAAASGPNILMLHGYRDQIAPLLLLVAQLDRASAPFPPPAPSTPPAVVAENGNPGTTDEALLRRIEGLERELAALRVELRARRPATAGRPADESR